MPEQDCPRCGCEAHYGRCQNDGCDAPPSAVVMPERESEQVCHRCGHAMDPTTARWAAAGSCRCCNADPKAHGLRTEYVPSVKRHRCMRCNQIFDCEHGDGCAAKFDVLPVIANPSDPMHPREHCPRNPDWDWIRAYGKRMRAAPPLTLPNGRTHNFGEWWSGNGDAVLERVRIDGVLKSDVERCVRIGWNASRAAILDHQINVVTVERLTEALIRLTARNGGESRTFVNGHCTYNARELADVLYEELTK